MNVVAVVSDKRLDMFVQTVYVNVKKGNLSTPIGEQAPINTPEASSGTVSSNKRVPKQDYDVKQKNSDCVTETQQFRRWFAGSKIVNADGSPKIMYHGSQAQFDTFDRKKAKSSGTYGKGFYFPESRILVQRVLCGHSRKEREPNCGVHQEPTTRR